MTDAEENREIKRRLALAFPGWKLSVRGDVQVFAERVKPGAAPTDQLAAALRQLYGFISVNALDRTTVSARGFRKAVRAATLTREAFYAGQKKNPAARKQFDAAYRAHRAWKTRRISPSEYDASTGIRGGMPAVHAESVHKAWRTDVPQRLTWKRDSAGRLDAYLGSGSTITVMPAPAWMRSSGFVAVVDRMGIGGPPRYVDARGTSEYGAVTGRSTLFSTESQAKAAASRYLLRLHRALAGKTVGQKLPRGNPKKKRNPRSSEMWSILVPNQHGEERWFGPYNTQGEAKRRLQELYSKGSPDGMGGKHVFAYGSGRLVSRSASNAMMVARQIAREGR